MRFFQRLLALLLSLLVMAVFYVFAVMMEDEESKRSDSFVVEAPLAPLLPRDSLESASPQAVADAFGVALPLPEGFALGRTEDIHYHTYRARVVTLHGAAATVQGVRPASAAGAILPKEADFVASSKALLGYQMLEARVAGKTMYALITPEAAFFIEPHQEGEPGGFSLLEPGP
jgi:hypothetical protein